MLWFDLFLENKGVNVQNQQENEEWFFLRVAILFD